MQHWKSKYESEASARAEEIEEIRRKYSIRIQEQEEQIETLIVKINNIEKQKSRLQSEVNNKFYVKKIIFDTSLFKSKYYLVCSSLWYCRHIYISMPNFKSDGRLTTTR